jgi:hypothetical protein
MSNETCEFTPDEMEEINNHLKEIDPKEKYRGINRINWKTYYEDTQSVFTDLSDRLYDLENNLNGETDGIDLSHIILDSLKGESNRERISINSTLKNYPPRIKISIKYKGDLYPGHPKIVKMTEAIMGYCKHYGLKIKENDEKDSSILAYLKPSKYKKPFKTIGAK